MTHPPAPLSAEPSTPLDEPLPESTGAWDESPRVPDQPWHEPPPQAPVKRTSITQVLLQFSILLAIVLLLLAFAIPNLYSSKIASNGEGPFPQNLKALATAQAQFIKKKDFYATSGKDLNANGTLIAADLTAAFEDWHNNGDRATPAPKAGYVYRMLHGDQDTGPRSFYNRLGDPSKGMKTWAATARAAEPHTSGENQYFITEAGTVYKHAEPLPGDPQYKQFLLDAVPNVDDLDSLGWTVAK